MKYVFVDMDGVIAEYGYPSGAYDGEFQKGNYLGKKPVNTVINEIISKYNDSEHIIMVCSACPNTKAVFEKNEWLNLNFNVPYENRIFTTLDEDKIDVIKYFIEDMMHGNLQEHALIIDDKGSILAKAHSFGMECYHPTQLLAIKKEDEQNTVDVPTESVIDELPVEKVNTEPEQTLDEGHQMTIEDLQKLLEEQNGIVGD